MKKRLLAILLTVCLVVSMAPAVLAASTTECTGTCSHQAVIGSTHYDTLQEACNAAQAGDTVTMIADVTLSAPLTISKSITLESSADDSGKYNTLTYTGNNRAIEMPNVADSDYNVTISNLTVDCTASYCERGINYNDNGTLTLNNVTVKGSGVTYALNLPGKSDGATVTITGGSYTGCIALNVWGENCTITATNAAFTTVDNTAEEGYSVVKLNNDGETSAEGSAITITGGSISVTGTNTNESTVSANNTSTGTITISDTTEVTGEAATTDVAVVLYEGTDNFYSCSTLQDAIDLAIETNAASVKLIKDIDLTETVTVNGTVTLDLNGHTITGTDNATGSFGLINIQPGAVLTINDGSTDGTGNITLTATNDRDWNAYSSVISNQRGKLIVNAGTIEHLGGTDMAYGIDNLTNGKGTYAETVINGGTVKSTYRAIRQFLNGVEAQNILTVNGGTIDGTNKSIWMQNASSKNNPGTLTVGDKAELNGDVYIWGNSYAGEWSAEVAVASAALSEGSTVTLSSAPAYTLSETNGVYGLAANPAYGKVASITSGETTTYYASVAEALTAAADGDTITVLTDLTLTETLTIEKAITLDLNGHTVTNATTATITINGGDLTVKDSSTAGTGAIVAASNGDNETKAAVLFDANGGKFTLQSGTLKSTKYAVRSYNVPTSEIVINGGTIEAEYYGVYDNSGSVIMNGGTITANTANISYGIAAYGTFTMNGGKVTAACAYCSQGTYDNTVAVIIGGELNATTYNGIYWPSAGSLTIKGGDITGPNAVHVRSGSLSITGGTLKGTGEGETALTIENIGGTSGYQAITSVSVTGGTFVSEKGSAVASIPDTTGSNADAVAVTKFITGGTYSDQSAEAYLADGYILDSYTDGSGNTVYGVEPVYTVTITIPDGATIVVQDSNGTEVSAEDNGTYELVNGTYTYTVSKDGYHTETASFTVNGADVNFSVELAAINYYTVVYTDGVNGVEIFADYVFEDIEEGSATPIVSNPTRFGYIFTGWNPEVSDTVTGDVTYTATWSYNPPYIPVVPTSYSITVEDATNGDVSADRSSATRGQTVTISVAPDTGYVLETLVVLDRSGKEITLTRVSENKYSFKMPASKVTVYATFMEDNTMLNYFVDVFAGDYYYDAVLWAVENNITNGTSAVEFSPSLTCTRAQAVTFMWRAAGSPEPVSSVMPFEDVAADTYYYKAVLWAVENGITNGTSATTFSPDADCTRAQIVTFLWRSQQSPANSAVNPFDDVAADAYYAKAVLWAVENEITNGTSATTFSPDADCTRAQIVTFLYRCMGDK